MLKKSKNESDYLKEKINKFFTYLEKQKEDLYKKQNKYPQRKSLSPQLKQLEGIYNFWNFNFSSIAFLRPNEEKRWRKYQKLKMDDIEIIPVLKMLYKRLDKYDLLKLGNQVFSLE